MSGLGAPADFVLGQEVRQALDASQPIVALESALITHGFPYPANLAIVRQMSQAIREAGAVPATLAAWRGKPWIGLSDAQVEALAADRDAVKVSVRDLPLLAHRGLHGGMTVAATAHLAYLSGIRVFATGGIGGVHRGHPEDVSADLPVLASTPIVVVCAGAKSLLDLPATREFLETWGVPVVGWRCAQFPAFYSRDSGLAVDATASEAADVAAIYRAQRALKLPQALLVTAPVPEDDELPAAEVEPLIAAAVREAESQGIKGKALTPFMLERVALLSEGRARRANESLLLHNAQVAAHIACELVRADAAV